MLLPSWALLLLTAGNLHRFCCLQAISPELTNTSNILFAR